VEIVNGRVDLDANVACIVIPGMGERCGPL
jgi:hypothetical protein